MKFQKRVIALMMTMMILMGLLPSAYAADEDAVLTTIGHSSTDTVALTGSQRDVTLTVQYDYSKDTVDLTNGLILVWDETRYKSVVAAPAAAARVNGDAVAVTVTFNDNADDDTAEKRQTVYQVKVVRAEKKEASYSGVINQTIEYPAVTSISFSQSDFTRFYSQNDGEALDHFTISGSNLVVGTLKFDGEEYSFDSPIAPQEMNKLTFEATNYYGMVSYDVQAYGAGTGALIGTAVLTITVYQAPKVQRELSKIAYTGAAMDFSAADFTNCCEMYDMALQSVEVTPSDTDCGTWYYGVNAMTGTTEIPASQIGSLYFEAVSEGAAAFSWRTKNSAGYSDVGTGTVQVEAPTITLRPYAASPSLKRGSTWTIQTAHFSYSPSTAALKYIKISSIPSSADGYLYLTASLAKNETCGYPAITAKKALRAGDVIPYDYIKYLRISTKSTSTSASVSFAWTATADSDVKTATWADPATYSVGFVSGGHVYYNTYTDVPVRFDVSDFNSSFSSSSGYALSYVTFKLPDKNCGTLYYDYDLLSGAGKKVSASTKYYAGTSPNISYVTFVPAEGYTGSLSIDYKAYNSSGEYFAGTLTIGVSSSVGGTVVYTVDKNSAVQLDAADFSDAFLNATGKELNNVKFMLPSSTYGRLYYGYESASDYDATVSSNRRYYLYSPSYLSYISFVPSHNYTGEVVINYVGYTESGSAYNGKLILLVVDSAAGIVSYTSKVNGITPLSGEDFADEFISVTGSVLSYVQFKLPSKNSGVLYYDYSEEADKNTKVSASTKYYNGSSPDISDISFVPVKDFVGEVEIEYTVYTASGVPYTGKLKIDVGHASSGSIYYETELNTPFRLNMSDFYSRYYANTGGSSLSYVTFTLPSSAYGRLYYDYTSAADYGTSVTSGTKYYVGSWPNISNIAFVPKTGYSGSFAITYTGYSGDGTGYSGKIYITVDSGNGVVTYRTSALEPLTFNASDFSTAFYDDTGNALSYVKFTPPSTAYGTLYYGYSASTSSGSAAVSYTTRYYVGSYPSLSRITFVPNPDFTGTFTIYYTAYDSSGDAYDGAVIMTVTDSEGGAVKYETMMNVPVTLDPDDFSAVFKENTGYSLSSVKFTLPKESWGQLYYGYVSESQYASTVSESTRYYRTTSPLLSNVTFVPAKDYFGTVSIKFTGYTTGGTAYSGKLMIKIAPPFSDVNAGYAWAGPAVSYLYNRGVVKGVGNGRFNPGNSMSRGDFMLMVCRAFELSASDPGNFSDVPYGSYYYNAIAAAKALDIAQGSGGKFYPDSEISRQDAMVILLRALEAVGNSPAIGSSNELSAYTDADEVSDYAVDAVAALVEAGVIKGSNGALKPKTRISRAEMAVMLYRVLML